jgi:hypothetical protein
MCCIIQALVSVSKQIKGADMNFWKPSMWLARQTSSTNVMVVDNRVFLLGLDELYRTAMKLFESRTLLPCARTVAKELHIQPASTPIEGYYYETPELQEYFRLMRSLQDVDTTSETRVRDLREFQLLRDVISSPLYGRPHHQGKLFPVGRDPLSQALKDTIPTWTVERLVNEAYRVAVQQDDISLVGLAARVQDAVILAAARESVVLYAEMLTLGPIDQEPEFIYEWHVDQALADAANRFIEEFNRFVSGALPKAEASNAEHYHSAYVDNEFVGRCVRIGQSEDRSQHYHWAIAVTGFSRDTPQPELIVDEFWSKHVWTTQKYRAFQRNSYQMRLFSTIGVPEDDWDFL